MPPESWCGIAVAEAARPTRASHSSPRRRASSGDAAELEARGHVGERVRHGISASDWNM
jgi:hypothetical protein